MKNRFKIVAALATFIFMSSFTSISIPVFIGTYGVSASDPSGIKLSIKSDNTFCYQDFSEPGKKIAVTGKWVLKGKKVILSSDNGAVTFHNVWSFSDGGKVAKSRKGFTFYRLTKLNE